MPTTVAGLLKVNGEFADGEFLIPQVLEMSKRNRIFRDNDRSDFPNFYTEHCHCRAVTVLQSFLLKQIRKTAIYTKSDGIVVWHNCMSRFDENNFEVTGTHVGLVYNFQVYEIIADRLKN